MKIIAMIPARYEASRFPGKLMQKLGDQTVILATYKATVATQLFDDVYVITDSDAIAAEILNNGGNVIKSKQEHECGSDRIAEAVADLDIDIVVNVQGDEPFTKKESLAKVLNVFKGDDAHKIDLASIMNPINEVAEINNPNCVKVVVDTHNFAKYFSRAPIPFPRDTHAGVQYYKHVGIYAFRKKAIIDFSKLPMLPLEASEKIECLRFLEYGRQIKMVASNYKTFGIDTPEDLVAANQYLKEQND